MLHTHSHRHKETGGWEAKMHDHNHDECAEWQYRCCWKTGEWILRENCRSVKFCGCMCNVGLSSYSLGVTNVRPKVLLLMIAAFPVWLDASVCLFLFITSVGFHCDNSWARKKYWCHKFQVQQQPDTQQTNQLISAPTATSSNFKLRSKHSGLKNTLLTTHNQDMLWNS